MEILNTRKSFGDLKVDEKLYILDPKDQTIKAVTVTKSFRHPKSTQTKEVWVIEAYLPFRLDYIDDAKLKEAAKYGTKVTQQFFVPKSDVMCLTVSTTPTIIATEEEHIRKWMAKPKSGLILPKRNW